jgi:DNA-binding Lrp family transcriptional regulator
VTRVLSIDRLDAQLIGLLGSNARMGVVELAATLGISRNTVQARLRRLDEAGLVTGFMPRIDLAGCGIAVEAFAALALEQGMLDDVVAQLTELPQVLEIHAVTGREDLVVRVATTNHAELQDLIQSIVAVPGVSHSNTSLALTTPLPYRVQPLLDHLTADSGWGRSTPAVGI